MNSDKQPEDTAVRAFYFDPDEIALRVLDQTLLPTDIKYIDVKGAQGGYDVIKSMKVRGAPCIAAVGCLAMVVECHSFRSIEDREEFTTFFTQMTDLISSARPTAVNLSNAFAKMAKIVHSDQTWVPSNHQNHVLSMLTEFCVKAIDIGLEMNIRLGEIGSWELLSSATPGTSELKVLTHCNTGSLATVGYGTALGIIRSLHKRNALGRVYFTETRPYNQGSRLTAWELVRDKIPATMIADNMVAYLMAREKIDAVIVGADRVAANGDTANKIGTLQMAILAKHYQVPFYVAAPIQTIDLASGSLLDVEIELRPGHELITMGTTWLAPREVDVWNPSFDVTPADLITKVISEYSACEPGEVRRMVNEFSKSGLPEAVF